MTQVAPLLPQAVWLLPPWQTPAVSQHPEVQLLGSHFFDEPHDHANNIVSPARAPNEKARVLFTMKPLG